MEPEKSTEPMPESNTNSSQENAADEAAQDQTLDIESALEQAMDAAQSSPVSLSTDEQVAEAQREALRAKAELENFRKRMQRDSELQLKYANMPIIRDMLDVIDNLNRASEAAKLENASAGALQAGVEMVAQQFASVLEKFGCHMIESQGQEFDPNYHEAIGQMPSEEFAAGKVAQEVAVGYRLHDRVVRPSSVLVSTGAPQAENG